MKFNTLWACLLLTLSANAQLQVKDIYPRLQTLDDKKLNSGPNTLFAGCVDGNCSDGQGVYARLWITMTGSSSGYSDRKTLQYDLYSGQFSEAGKNLKGQWRTFVINTTQKKKGKDYKPETSVDLRKDTAEGWLEYEGDMAYFTEPYYYQPHGEGMHYRQARWYGYKSLSGFFEGGDPIVATIEYNNGPLSSFTGLVNEFAFPLLGEARLANGSIYQGSLVNHSFHGPGILGNQKGVFEKGAFAKAGADVYVPSAAFWKNFKTSLMGNQQLDVYWHRDMGKQKLSLTGVLLDANGKIAPSGYSGKGIFFESARKFYAGGFQNGVPSGEGLLYNSSGRETWGNPYGIDDSFRYGVFDKGTFTSGHIVSASASAKNDMYSESRYKPIYGDIKTMAVAAPVYSPPKPGDEELAAGLEELYNGNKTAAAELFRKAAARNNPRGCYELAMCYLNGIGIPVNRPESINWHFKAANLGYPRAMGFLGYTYEYGYDVPKDRAKAKEWYKKASEAGDEISKPIYEQMYWMDLFPGLKGMGNAISKMNAEDQRFYFAVERDLQKVLASGNYRADYSVSDSWSLTSQELNGGNLAYTIVFYIQKPIAHDATVGVSYSGGVVTDNKVTTGSSCKLVTKYEGNAYYKTTCNNGSINVYGGSARKYFFTLAASYQDFQRSFPLAKIAWVVLFHQ